MFGVKQALKTLAIGVTAVALFACGSVENVETTVSDVSQKEANKAIVKEYIEALGTPEFGTLRTEMQTDDHVRTRREFDNLFYNMDGDSALSEASQPLYEAITDRKNTITRLLGEGDWVAATYRLSGVQSGNLYGISETNHSIDIDAAAVIRLEDGKIAESWFLADEAGLLRQLGAKLPPRQDGELNIGPKLLEMRTYDEALAEHLADPKDTREFMQTRLLLAYKSQPENRPADYQFEGRPYSNYLRSGIVNIVERGAELGVEGSHGLSLSDRRDMIVKTISDGDQSMMLFRLTAQNTGPLYGIPSSGNPLDDWELGFARFEGDTWVDGWWFKDELGYLLNIGNEEALNFLVGD